MADETAIVTKPKHRNQHPPAVTKAKQRAFLEHVRTTGRHVQSCTAAGIPESSPFHWAIASKDFAKRWDEAKIQGDNVLLSIYEESLDKTVLAAESIDDFARVQNSRFFRMKRLDPRYRDTAPVHGTVPGPVSIQLNFGTSASIQYVQAVTQVDKKV